MNVHSTFSLDDLIDPSDYSDFGDSGELAGLPAALLSKMQIIPPECLAQIWESLDSIKWGGRREPVFSRQFNVFAQGGYYPEVDRLLGHAHALPIGTEGWLREKILPALRTDEKLLVVGSRPGAFLIPSSVFVAEWARICGSTFEVVFILPPQEDWLLVWHYNGAFFAFCRRNPDAQTFLLDLPQHEAERIAAGAFEGELYLPIVQPQSYPEADQLRVRIDYPRALLPSPESALDDCVYYPLSRAALEHALQVCLVAPHEMALEAVRRLDEFKLEPDFPFGWKVGTQTWRQAIAAGSETHPVWLEAYRWATPKRKY